MWRTTRTRRSALSAIALGLVGTLVAATPESAGAGPVPITEQTFIVAIDAGHGGTNRGAVAHDGQSREKDVTLALAFALQDALATRLPGARVVMTREADRSLALAQRVAAANGADADVFISLHANASPDKTQVGFETYVLDARASNLDAARTARRENDDGLAVPAASETMPEVGAMLRQLEMTGHRQAAARLAKAIQDEQAERFPDRVDRGVKQAPFDVLMGARMPAVLFEAGFLDHDGEGAILLDPEGRERIADGLADALVTHYREHRQTD